MLHDNTEAWIWMMALEAALTRLSRADTRHERLAALEAVEEAREHLDALLDAMRDDALRDEVPETLDMN